MSPSAPGRTHTVFWMRSPIPQHSPAMLTEGSLMLQILSLSISFGRSALPSPHLPPPLDDPAHEEKVEPGTAENIRLLQITHGQRGLSADWQEIHFSGNCSFLESSDRHIDFLLHWKKKKRKKNAKYENHVWQI